MFRFSIPRFISANASGRQAVERQFGMSNPVARFASRMADKLARRRKIDDLADFVDQELRFEFTPSFEYAMGAVTLFVMAVPMYLVCEGVTPPSKVTVLVGMMTEKEWAATWDAMTNQWHIPWWTSSIGHAALFFVLYQFTPYFRFPFFVHVMAPFYRKMGWVTHRHSPPGVVGGKMSEAEKILNKNKNRNKKNKWY
jgi:hypothetical protein